MTRYLTRAIGSAAAAAVLCSVLAACTSTSTRQTVPSPPATSTSSPASAPSSSAAPTAATSSVSPRVGQPYPSISHSSSPGTPTAASGPTAAVLMDPTATALGAVRAIKGSDTTVDADPYDTLLRASAWLTPGYVAQLRRYPPVAAPGAQWNSWYSHRAMLRVSVRLAGDTRPPDRGGKAFRQVIATITPVGRDGWHGPAMTDVVFVTLQNVAGRWLVAATVDGN